MRAWIAAAMLSLAGCAAAPGSALCEHCACTPIERSVARPLLCSTLRTDAECCVMALPSS